MFRQYFLIAYRQLLNNKFYSTLIGGALILGFVSFILLSGYFLFENSFDKFHTNLPNLHRVNFELYRAGKLDVVNAVSCAPVGPVLYDQLSQVKGFTRLYQRRDGIRVKNAEETKWFSENAVYHADSGIFQLFSIHLLEGHKPEALKKPFTAYISKAIAEKLYGSANPIGEKLFLSDDEEYTIEGIFDNLPQNSHLQVEVLLSFSTLEALAWSKENIRSDWSWYSFYNYVLLEGNYDIDELNKQIAEITKVYTKTIDERINGQMQYKLYPVSKIYLQSDLQGEMDIKGAKTTVQVVELVAVSVLLIALVNYINLMSSWTMGRVQETAIRAVLGNSPLNIFFQFFTEITFHLLITGTLSLMLSYYLWSPFNVLIGYSIPVSALFNVKYIGLYVGILIALSFILSLYYAVVTKTSSPGKLLKGDFKTSGKGLILRKSIVIFQFFCAISMIIGTLAMHNQIQFIQQRSPGFDSEYKLSFKIRRTRGEEQFYQNLKNFQSSLQKFPWITQMTASSAIPGEEVGWTSGGKLIDQQTTAKIHNYGVDGNFLSTLDISLAAGENFSSNEHVAAQSVLINEEAMKVFGYNKPTDILNKVYLHGGDAARPFEIVGVVKNFHQRGLKYKIEPIIFHYLPDNTGYSGPAYLTLNLIDTKTLAARMSEIEKIFKEIYPERTLESQELDNFYFNQYNTDKNILHTLGTFSILSIIISSIGLIGLISFTAFQRAKEIGVRKVLGATVLHIQFLIGKEFLYMILLATIISFPVCYKLLTLWLSNFEYQTDLTLWPFLAGSILTIFFSILVISSCIWRYAADNPVKALKSDG